jgi:hypothetical protein
LWHPSKQDVPPHRTEGSGAVAIFLPISTAIAALPIISQMMKDTAALPLACKAASGPLRHEPSIKATGKGVNG